LSNNVVTRWIAVGVLAIFFCSCSTQITLAQQTPASGSAAPAPAQAGDSGQTGNSTSKDPAAAKDPAPAKDPIQDTKQQNADQTGQSGTSKDRLFFALPNFLTLENAGQVPPLSAKQKFAVVTRGSFDYVQLPWYLFLSAISQAEDSEPGYGQGWAGYGKRVGASFADGTIENFMTGAVFPVVLHQDPRYFQLGHGSFARRALYAASRNLITRTDSGKHQFNYSEVFGGALAASISTYSYHPKSHVFSTPNPPYYRFVPSDRTLSNTAKVWGTQYGYDTLTLVVKEFWPDVRRALKHQPNGSLAQQAQPPR